MWSNDSKRFLFQFKSFQSARVLCFWTPCWVHHSSLQFPGVLSVSCIFFFVARRWLSSPLELLFSAFFWWFLCIPHLPDRWNKRLSSFFDNMCTSVHILWEIFLSAKWTVWIHVTNLTKYLSTFTQQSSIPLSCTTSRSSLEGHKVDLDDHCDDDIWILLFFIDQKFFSDFSVIFLFLSYETFLVLKFSTEIFSLRTVVSHVRVGPRNLWSLLDKFVVPSAKWVCKFTFLCLGCLRCLRCLGCSVWGSSGWCRVSFSKCNIGVRFWHFVEKNAQNSSKIEVEQKWGKSKMGFRAKNSKGVDKTVAKCKMGFGRITKNTQNLRGYLPHREPRLAVRCDAGSSLAGCCSSGRWSGIVISLMMALTFLLLLAEVHLHCFLSLPSEGLSVVVAIFRPATPSHKHGLMLFLLCRGGRVAEKKRKKEKKKKREKVQRKIGESVDLSWMNFWCVQLFHPQSEYFLSKTSPRSVHTQERYQNHFFAKLKKSYWSRTNSDDFPPLLQKELLGLWMVLRVAFCKVLFFRSRSCHSAESQSIPQNQPTCFIQAEL